MSVPEVRKTPDNMGLMTSGSAENLYPTPGTGLYTRTIAQLSEYYDAEQRGGFSQGREQELFDSYHHGLRGEEQVRQIAAQIITASSTEAQGYRNAQKALIESVVVPGRQAEQALIVANLPLVFSLARRMVGGPGAEFDDYVQNGTVGLIEAVRRYRLSHGTRFMTYAHTYVSDAILNYKYNPDILEFSGPRLPAHVLGKLSVLRKKMPEALDAEEANSLKKLERQAYARHTLSVEELRFSNAISEEHDNEAAGNPTAAPYLPLTATAPRLKTSDRTHKSNLDAERWLEIPDNPMPTIADVLPEESDFTEGVDQRLYVEQLLSTLDPKLAEILRLRFGIGDDLEHTFSELGLKKGVTGEGGRLIVRRALKQLRVTAASQIHEADNLQPKKNTPSSKPQRKYGHSWHTPLYSLPPDSEGLPVRGDEAYKKIYDAFSLLVTSSPWEFLKASRNEDGQHPPSNIVKKLDEIVGRRLTTEHIIDFLNSELADFIAKLESRVGSDSIDYAQFRSIFSQLLETRRKADSPSH